jgi:tRNA 2-thiouridine synthesizing protein B
MLHTVNKSPYSHQTLSECLRVCGKNAAILLIEDAVYAALAQSSWAQQLNAGSQRVYALAPDVAARGLDGRIDADIQLVDYAGFVQLCCEHTTIHSWY